MEQYKRHDRLDVVCAIQHGSHLYGTANEHSDYDFKCVYLPSLRQTTFSVRPPGVRRIRYDKDGNTVGDREALNAGGSESEHFTVTDFVAGFCAGQAWAFEFLFAVLQNRMIDLRHDSIGTNSRRETCSQLFYELCHVLADNPHRNVQPMLGFAVKQTMDYVHRGERLAVTRRVADAIYGAWVICGLEPKLRLDSMLPDQQLTVLDHIANTARVEIGRSTNGGREFRTLTVNGREYLETMPLREFHRSISALIESYGARSTRAEQDGVDWKSLSHAVRVYDQIVEYLDLGTMVFPRPNPVHLLAIKNGELPLEFVKQRITSLELCVNSMLMDSKLPDPTPEWTARVFDQCWPLVRTMYQVTDQ
jgi:hypothetical protein